MLIFSRNKLSEEFIELEAKKSQLISNCDEESEDDNGED